MAASNSSVGSTTLATKAVMEFREAEVCAVIVSGGFAIVQPGSQLSINAVEGFPLEDFSSESVKSQISEAQKIASGSGSEQDIAEAQIELEVWTAADCNVGCQG